MYDKEIFQKSLAGVFEIFLLLSRRINLLSKGSKSLFQVQALQG